MAHTSHSLNDDKSSYTKRIGERRFEIGCGPVGGEGRDSMRDVGRGGLVREPNGTQRLPAGILDSRIVSTEVRTIVRQILANCRFRSLKIALGYVLRIAGTTAATPINHQSSLELPCSRTAVSF